MKQAKLFSIISNKAINVNNEIERYQVDGIDLFPAFCQFLSANNKYSRLYEILQNNISQIFEFEENSKDYLGLGNKSKKYNTVLAYGEVQSGKTMNMISSIYKAIDLGYKYIFVSAGNIIDLKNQTIERFINEDDNFQKIIRNKRYKDNSLPYIDNIKNIINENSIFKTKIDFVDLDNFDNLDTSVSDTMKVFFVLKQADNYNKILKIFDDLEKPSDSKRKRIMFIDDEADWGFYKSNKNGESNELFNILLKIRNLFLNKNYFFKYVAYTATPYKILSSEAYDDFFINQKVVLLKNKSINKDIALQTTYLKENQPFYCGIDFFHPIKNEEINYLGVKTNEIVIDVGINNVEEDIIYSTVILFLISSYIFCFGDDTSDKDNFTQCLIFIGTPVTPQTKALISLEKKIMDIANKNVNYDDFDFINFFEIKNERIIDLINSKISSINADASNLKRLISFIFKWMKESKNNNLIVQLSGEEKPKDSEKYMDNAKPVDGVTPILIIGGHKISRGITFDNLICELMLKDTEQVDTALQRARWFGYRSYNLIKNMNIILDGYVHDSLSEAINEDRKWRDLIINKNSK